MGIHDLEETVRLSPRVLPDGWEKININTWINQRIGLAVILTAEQHSIGPNWLHVSVSRQGRIPSYKDLCLVKYLFIGRDQKAIQVFPPEKEHVSDNPTVLHLWCCIGVDIFPDFRIDGTL